MLERPVVKIAPDTYLVSEYKLVNMFLVVGKHRAALIDTGGGIGPLPEDIERLTGLPLVVIATHGDPDHVGGAGHFPHVYLHPLDWEHSRRFPLNNTMRKWFVKTRAPVRNPDNERKIDALVPRQELPQPSICLWLTVMCSISADGRWRSSTRRGIRPVPFVCWTKKTGFCLPATRST